MVQFSHCTIPTSHVTIFCHIWWFLFVSLTYDGTILTLRDTNITCNCTFVTFSSSLFFSSHFIVLSSHCAVPTSHVIELLSHSVVSLFFLTFYDTIRTLYSINITCDCTFVTFGGFLIFFPHILWYQSHIAQYNITCDCTFVIFGSSLIFFPHILWYQPHIM